MCRADSRCDLVDHTPSPVASVSFFTTGRRRFSLLFKTPKQIIDLRASPVPSIPPRDVSSGSYFHHSHCHTALLLAYNNSHYALGVHNNTAPTPQRATARSAPVYSAAASARHTQLGLRWRGSGLRALSSTDRDALARLDSAGVGNRSCAAQRGLLDVERGRWDR